MSAAFLLLLDDPTNQQCLFTLLDDWKKTKQEEQHFVMWRIYEIPKSVPIKQALLGQMLIHWCATRGCSYHSSGGKNCPWSLKYLLCSPLEKKPSDLWWTPPPGSQSVRRCHHFGTQFITTLQSWPFLYGLLRSNSCQVHAPWKAFHL